MPWSVIIERLTIEYAGGHAPSSIEIRYRRYELMPYGLLPLTDDEWERGTFNDRTPFGVVGERHYERISEDGTDGRS
jgi:hypothetical protein